MSTLTISNENCKFANVIFSRPVQGVVLVSLPCGCCRRATGFDVTTWLAWGRICIIFKCNSKAMLYLTVLEDYFCICIWYIFDQIQHLCLLYLMRHTLS